MKAKIDKRLNLVLTVDRNGGGKLYVHATPITREVFEANFLAIGEAMTILYKKGIHPTICTGMAYLALKKLIVEQPDEYRDLDGSLLQEIWRKANVLVPTDRGWETVPFGDAMQNEAYLDADEVAEIMNYLCYFTCASWVHGSKELGGIYEVLKAYGAQILSSDCMAFRNSLTTSKPAANIGAMATASPIPS